MTAAGGGRGVWWWAVLVVVGGGLTLWLQDQNEPEPPARWERAPAPRLSAEVHDTVCPSEGSFEEPVIVVCLRSDATARLEPDRALGR
ncbi:hypothetical protein ACWD5Q_24040 [Streptomyces sp. NPDC002513]